MAEFQKRQDALDELEAAMRDAASRVETCRRALTTAILAGADRLAPLEALTSAQQLLELHRWRLARVQSCSDELVAKPSSRVHLPPIVNELDVTIGDLVKHIIVMEHTLAIMVSLNADCGATSEAIGSANHLLSLYRRQRQTMVARLGFA